MRRLLGAALALLPLGSSTRADEPAWFREAVWYQIFPERFCNGDRGNDPTVESLEGTWPYLQPSGWHVRDWGSDWYAPSEWELDNGKGFYVNAQMRRYGGDLQGIWERLDHLEALGVNALYLNPVFESPSLHKYGARFYHHIDRHFGPSPEDDATRWADEDPADPSTWVWTAADRLFLQLVAECHRRGIRVIIDGVFNHVGIPFWALERARAEGPGSRYAKWFTIHAWDDPATPEDEFDYEGWAGIKDLPVFRMGDTGPHPEVKAHFKAVLERWMTPVVDGQRVDGIDGWRLDVAAEVPLEFWKEFRGWVKTLNPEAFLTGEIWWENYKENRMANARPWLGTAFDSVMNYRLADALFRFFIQRQGGVTARQFVGLVELLESEYGTRHLGQMQNLLGSHDTSRIGSVATNPGYRIDHDANLQSNRGYETRKPNTAEMQRMRQVVAFQFLAPGAPYVYYGDEVGMWGADDPDCRKPMVWDDIVYKDEEAHPFGQAKRRDKVEQDHSLLDFHRRLIALRHDHIDVLSRGSMKFEEVDDEARSFVFVRELDGDRIIGVFNAGDKGAEVGNQVPADGEVEFLFGDEGWGNGLNAGGFVVLRLAPR